jgi:hypothetical protein
MVFPKSGRFFVKGLVPDMGSSLLFCLFGGVLPVRPREIWRQCASRLAGAIRMRDKNRWALFWLVLVAVLAGTGLGLWYGWVVNPVEYKDTDVAHLYAVYRDEFILMVGEAYAVDGDLDTARARLALLFVPDPADAVADRAEVALSQGASELDVQALARLAVALGAQRDTLQDYLAPSSGATTDTALERQP